MGEARSNKKANDQREIKSRSESAKMPLEAKRAWIKTYLDGYGLALPPDEVEEFCSLFSERHYARGQFLAEEGKMSWMIGFISQGLVRFYLNTYEGKEFNQTFKKEGQLIADYVSALANEPSPLFIQAIEPTTILQADYRKVKEMYSKHRDWERLGRLIIEENFLIKFRRETTLLTLSAKERYERFLIEFKDFVPRLTQQDIALYIGVNPSTLNRLLKE
jgi:CRP-like cAMP-binding protein